ncbi:MAG: hypothetical protein ACK4FL_02705, partial [Microgenomates group bacterium]
MRRIEKHQRKQLTKTIILLAFILIVTLYFIFTIGIKILLNTSLFIANLFGKKTQTSPASRNDVYSLIKVD